MCLYRSLALHSRGTRVVCKEYGSLGLAIGALSAPHAPTHISLCDSVLVRTALLVSSTTLACGLPQMGPMYAHFLSNKPTMRAVFNRADKLHAVQIALRGLCYVHCTKLSPIADMFSHFAPLPLLGAARTAALCPPTQSRNPSISP